MNFKSLFLIFIFFVHCKGKNSESENVVNNSTLFILKNSDNTGINFENTVNSSKEFNVFKYRNYYNGGGVAIGDINNDNLPDIYFTSNLGKNKLFLNKGNWEFEDISKKSNTEGNKIWSTGASMVDINADGFLDIYVCNAGNVVGEQRKNELFINNGDLTFREDSKKYGLDHEGISTHASFFDYDNDGDLDVYILNNSFIPVNTLGNTNQRYLKEEDWKISNIFIGGGDKLFRNDNGVYSDVTESAGIFQSLIGFGLGISVSDINLDGWLDIYISNDFYERDYLYINKKNGTFKEEIKKYISHMSMFSMGADIADINNDGRFDIFVTDMLPENDQRLKRTVNYESYDLYNLKLNRDFHHQYMQNTLQINSEYGKFLEVAFQYGVQATDWSWGSLLFDMNNDGFNDLYVANGILHDLTDQDFIDFFANEIIQNMVIKGKKDSIDNIIKRMPKTPIPNYSYKNIDGKKFEDVSSLWKLDIPSFSNGSAYGDLDNDGDLDLVINNNNMLAFVFENKSRQINQNNFVKVSCRGKGKNTFGIGAKIIVYTKDNDYTKELITTRGFQSSTSPIVHFGLGKQHEIDSIVVLWPGEKKSIKSNIKVNTEIMFDEKLAKPLIPLKEKKINTFFTLIDSSFIAPKEDNHNDFDFEPLMPKMLSKEGPAVAVADVNNDGLDDVFIGGARGFSANLYLQNSDGQFRQLFSQFWNTQKEYEDTYAVFFDANGDNFQDLVVGSGGNTIKGVSKFLTPRLYINQGNGKFEQSTFKFPETNCNSSVIKAEDFDDDGDIDLFIGSRNVSQIYGISPRSFLFKNDGLGNFRDVTPPSLKFAGMITDAVWVDIIGSKKKDLIVVGEWMSPKLFENKSNILFPSSWFLDTLSGWWNTVSVQDLDNDNDYEIILGNLGMNSLLSVNEGDLFKMLVDDFDDNGTIEQILTKRIDDKDKPVALKRELTTQLNILKKKFIKFKDYASKSVNELISKKSMLNTMVLQSNFSKSVVCFKNNDKWEVEHLPEQVQFAPINAILNVDKGILPNLSNSFIIGGNQIYWKPQFGRLDASFGSLIERNKEGWKVISPLISGIDIKGQIQEFRWIKNSTKKPFVLVVRNNAVPLLYKVNQ